MSKKRRVKKMGAVMDFKKVIRPALNKQEIFDMFFDKKKRESIYRKFDEKSFEPNEDNFVDVMKKRIKLDD